MVGWPGPLVCVTLDNLVLTLLPMRLIPLERAPFSQDEWPAQSVLLVIKSKASSQILAQGAHCDFEPLWKTDQQLSKLKAVIETHTSREDELLNLSCRPRVPALLPLECWESDPNRRTWKDISRPLLPLPGASVDAFRKPSHSKTPVVENWFSDTKSGQGWFQLIINFSFSGNEL